MNQDTIWLLTASHHDGSVPVGWGATEQETQDLADRCNRHLESRPPYVGSWEVTDQEFAAHQEAFNAWAAGLPVGLDHADQVAAFRVYACTRLP
jgi:hypothetical protein